MRTAKGGTTRKGPDFPAFWEGVHGALLLIGAAARGACTNYKQIREINIFALVLVVQSLPFLAAVALALLEGSRFNEFAYWRSVEAKVAETAAAARRRSPRRRHSCRPPTSRSKPRSRRRSVRTRDGSALSTLRALSPQRRLHQLAPNTTSRPGSPRR